MKAQPKVPSRHLYCPFCGGNPVFQYDFERRRNFVEQEAATVNVYKCAECGKLWMATVNNPWERKS